VKTLAVALSFITEPSRQRDLRALINFLAVFLVLVFTYTVIFQLLLVWEPEEVRQEGTWITGIYWVFVTMSTLGYGDITLTSDIGRLFSVVVLLSGTTFMLVLLPFMFIQFFYVPWIKAHSAARAPRILPEDISGHVILTGLGAVELSLIHMLKRTSIPYAVIVNDLEEALRLHDEGISVLLGEVDLPATYQNARVEKAALVVATQRDTTNTNIAHTVREISESVTIVATASYSASVDILQLAGCNQVLQLGEMLGQALSRRILGRDSKCHVVGRFGELLIAEAAVAGTPLVGRSLREVKLASHAKINVIGVWDRGRFALAGPETILESSSVLLLAGSQADMQEYDALFCLYGLPDSPVVIIGGGRVGRATAKALLEQGYEYRIVEKNSERVRDRQRYILGDAAEIEVLEQAGIMKCSSVVITTHDDDINVYLTIYCRRLRPDVQILVRANQDRNVSTLHRAGADFVMSYASSGASALFNMLKGVEFVLLAEGLDVFRAPVPPALVGRSLKESRFRQVTGCNVVAVEVNGMVHVNPDPDTPLPEAAELIVVGDREAEERFFAVGR
jgi:voltage-gated potassium channel